MSKIKLPHASGNSMSIAAPATNPASDLELKLPATVGTARQVLKNSSTAGTLEFADPVFFKAGLTATSTSVETLVFGNEVFDNGNNYDATTGKFTCPVAGVYFFSASIMRNATSGNAQISIRRTRSGGESLVAIALQGNASGVTEYAMINCTAMESCNANDEFWVKNDGGQIYGSSSGNNVYYSQFMGVLLA